MPRSKNDPYKRKCAQALNHLAGATLDLNDVYTAFQQQAETLKSLPPELVRPETPSDIERYEKMTEELKTAMMSTAVIREAIVRFIGQAWDLDENTIMVYMQ